MTEHCESERRVIIASAIQLAPRIRTFLSSAWDFTKKTASPRGIAVFLMIRGIVLLPRQRERAVEGEDAVADGV